MGGEGCQKGVEAQNAMGRKGNGALDGINKPPQDDFADEPGGVALKRFFYGVRFFPGRVVRGGESAKDGIDAFKEGATNRGTESTGLLGGQDEIVHKTSAVVRGGRADQSCERWGVVRSQ